MARFSIELAKPSDDADLRALVANDPLGDRVQFIVRREPSFFHSVRIQGSFNQVGVVRDTETGRAVGCGTRSVRSAFINGTAANLGYLGGLWLDPMVRSGTLLARGYRAFHQLHRDRQAQFYITTIAEENEEARQMLTSGRAGLPQYDDLGRYLSVALIVGRGKLSPTAKTDVQVVRGTPSSMEEVEDCLQRNGRRRQFFPCYLAHEFLTGGPHLRDFDVNDFYVALRDNRVVGVAAKWDQTRFRQLVLSGYRGALRVARPWYNAAARLLRRSPLPAPGTEIRYFVLSFVAIDDDNRHVFGEVLRAVYNDAVEAGYPYFLAGFHEDDPLRGAVMRYPHYAHQSRLYVVYWEDGAEFRQSLDERVPYLELATT